MSPTFTRTTTPTVTPNCYTYGDTTVETSGYVVPVQLNGNQVTFVSFVHQLTFYVYLGNVSGGAQIQAALYNGNPQPSSLVLASAITNASNGWNGLSATVQTVTPGTYWLLFQVSDNKSRVPLLAGTRAFLQGPATTFGHMPAKIFGTVFPNRAKYSAYITVCH